MRISELSSDVCSSDLGLVGSYGATHAGAFDVAYLATLPNMVVMAAADEVELAHMVHTMALHDSSPIAVRYPRGSGAGLDVPKTPERLRSEEHTSELQSLMRISYAVFCLKKKTQIQQKHTKKLTH